VEESSRSTVEKIFDGRDRLPFKRSPWSMRKREGDQGHISQGGVREKGGPRSGPIQTLEKSSLLEGGNYQGPKKRSQKKKKLQEFTTKKGEGRSEKKKKGEV